MASFHGLENQDLERGDNIFEGIRLERAGPGFCVAFIIQSERIHYDISGVNVDCGHRQSLKFFLIPFLRTGISFPLKSISINFIMYFLKSSILKQFLLDIP